MFTTTTPSKGQYDFNADHKAVLQDEDHEDYVRDTVRFAVEERIAFDAYAEEMAEAFDIGAFGGRDIFSYPLAQLENLGNTDKPGASWQNLRVVPTKKKEIEFETRQGLCSVKVDNENQQDKHMKIVADPEPNRFTRDSEKFGKTYVGKYLHEDEDGNNVYAVLKENGEDTGTTATGNLGEFPMLWDWHNQNVTNGNPDWMWENSHYIMENADFNAMDYCTKEHLECYNVTEEEVRAVFGN